MVTLLVRNQYPWMLKGANEYVDIIYLLLKLTVYITVMINYVFISFSAVQIYNIHIFICIKYFCFESQYLTGLKLAHNGLKSAVT